MFGVDGQPSWNIFENDWSNHIPTTVTPKLVTLGKKFATGTPYILTIGLSDWAQFDQHGKEVSKPHFPWSLVFRPNPSLKSRYTSTYQKYFTEQLSEIEPNINLFSVYAIAEPESTEEILIGNVELVSQMTTSYWGDRYMFFKHQDMKEDHVFRPEWEAFTPTPAADQATKTGGCPFKKLQQDVNNFLGFA